MKSANISESSAENAHVLSTPVQRISNKDSTLSQDEPDLAYIKQQISLSNRSEVFEKVSRSFEGNVKSVWGKIKGCFKGVFGGVQGYLKEVQRKFQGSFKGASRVFQGRFKGILNKFLGCFKRLSRLFQGTFKGVPRKLLGCLKED